MAVIAVVQQLEKKSEKLDGGKKQNKSTPWRLLWLEKRREGEMKKQPDFYKISRADEDDKLV